MGILSATSTQSTGGKGILNSYASPTSTTSKTGVGILNQQKIASQSTAAALATANATYQNSSQGLIENTIKGLPAATVQVAKGIVQGTLKDAAAIGQTFLHYITLGAAPAAVNANGPATGPGANVQNTLSNILFGTDDSFSLQSQGEQYPLVPKGSPIAQPIAVAGFALNFLGGEGAEAKAISDAAKVIAGTEDIVKTTSVLAKIGIPEDIAKQVAPSLTSLTDESAIKTQLSDLKSATLPTAEQAAKQATKTVTQSIAEHTSGLTTTPADRGFVTSVNNFAPELAAKVAGQYIPRTTDSLAQMARDFIARDEATAIEVAKESKSELGVATAGELISKYVTAAREATVPAVKNMYLDQAADIANTAAPRLTELGRAVQAASILGRLTPEAIVRTVAKDIAKHNAEQTVLGKIVGSEAPKLTGEQVDVLTKMADAVQKMPESTAEEQTAKSIATHQLLDHMASLIPSTFLQKVLAVWKAGLLTGVKTSGLNTLSNLFHGTTELIKDIPATAVDTVASLFTKKRTIALTGSGTLDGIKEGFLKGVRYFKTGYDERLADPKLDYKKVNFGSSPVARAIQRYEETVFRTLGAEDQPFYYGAKAHSIVSQAQAAWKTSQIAGRIGANGEPIVNAVFKDAAEKAASKDEFIQEMIQNPTDTMLQNATHDAEMAVFQNQTKLGEAASAVKRAVPASELILPFSRTPAAVAMQLINYSPAGAIKPILDSILASLGKKEFDQRIFSQDLGRAAVGTGVMWLGMKLFDKGRISLGYPTDERTQQEWKAEGKQPNSILVGGKWRNAAALGPVGAALVVGGWFASGLKDTGSIMGGLTQASVGAGTSLTQQTFLQGVNQFTDALNNPSQYSGTLFRGLIGSLVPTIAGDISTATDKYQRRTAQGIGPGGSLTGTFESKIPGLREELQPQVDIYGNPIARATGPISSAIDPSRPTTQISDPVINEVKRLQDAGYSASPTQLGDKNGYAALTPAQNTALWERAGVLLKGKLDKLVALPAYQQLDDTKKAQVITDFATQAGNIARAEAVLSLTQGLQGDALKTELSKLKTGKLLNQDVFTVWSSLR